MPVFGQLVTGPPGAGKSTYCHGMHQFLTALNRPVAIINLDPAVSSPHYPCAANITDLISLEDIMDEHGLGPNGGMLYAMEYLEANFDWLEEQLVAVLEEQGAQRGEGYIIFDTPGQVELWTNHESMKNIITRLTKQDYRLVALHLSDAHYVTDASKFISVLLLSLRAMLQLELPHINVLSKMDLLSTYGELPFKLDYYTEVQDLEYLAGSLNTDRSGPKYAKLNTVICQLVEEYGLVGFETLAVEDKASMLKLLRILDKAVGYAFVPPQGASVKSIPEGYGQEEMKMRDLTAALPTMSELGGVMDVQERWIDDKESWDEWEKNGKGRKTT